VRSRAGAFLAGAAAAGFGWGWFEAGWLRERTIDLLLPRLPEDLVGTRIVHLSDFHLGVPSRGANAVARAAAWAAARRADLVVVTGDLVSRPRGEAELRSVLATLGRSYVVLGNHDVAHARDPFLRATALTHLEPARLLRDEADVVEIKGRRVQIVGVDPRSYHRGRSRPWRLADGTSDLRILLCHFPHVLRQLPPGSFDLVLSGHMHDGQIALPLPRDKFRFAHPRARFNAGTYSRAGIVMHVSPGLGTTFVPIRFYARPEATELVLQRG
jgi:predicted MPP superfamily phosphohydrolase